MELVYNPIYIYKYTYIHIYIYTHSFGFKLARNSPPSCYFSVLANPAKEVMFIEGCSPFSHERSSLPTTSCDVCMIQAQHQFASDRVSNPTLSDISWYIYLPFIYLSYTFHTVFVSKHSSKCCFTSPCIAFPSNGDPDQVWCCSCSRLSSLEHPTPAFQHMG